MLAPPARVRRLGRGAIVALVIAAGPSSVAAQYPVAPMPAINIRALTDEPRISGYLSLRETLRSDTSMFTVNRARMAVQAAPAPFVGVRLQVDFAAIGRTTGARGDTVPAIQVTDAFVQLGLPDSATRLEEMLRPALMIGQFRTPFGLEALTSFSTVLTANRALVSDRVSTRRDRGVQLQVHLPRFVRAGVALVDGEGANRTSNPDGRQMAIGRLSLLPIPTLSVSGKWAGQGADHRWGYDARWVHGPAVLEGELIQREGPLSTTMDREQRGGYLLAAYRVLPWLQPVVKWEQLHEHLITPMIGAYSRWTYTTVGVNLVAPGERFRMQLDWIDRSANRPVPKGELVAQLQAIF